MEIFKIGITRNTFKMWVKATIFANPKTKQKIDRYTISLGLILSLRYLHD